MVIASLFLGVLAGSLGFLAALLIGLSFWASVISYAAVGAGTVLAFAAIRFSAMSARQERGAGIPDSAKDAWVDVAVLAKADPGMAALGPDPAMRILAVDDDPLILDLIPKIAAQVGCHDVTTVSSGALALQAIKAAEQPFDCLLLDIDMPGMDGIDLCGRIRSLDRYQDVAIVMLTALSEVSFLQRAFRAGATDYVTKPFDVIAFAERLTGAQAWTKVRHSTAGGLRDDPAFGAGQATGKLLSAMGNVPLLADRLAFETCLARLPSSAMPGAYVMAIAVDGAHDATRNQPLTTDLSQLACVAAAIDDVFGETDYIMVYDESGTFVLAGNDAQLPFSAQLAADILRQFDRRVSQSARHPLRLSVGSAVRSGGKSVQRARIATDTAMHLAQQRALQSSTGQHPVGLRQAAQK